MNASMVISYGRLRLMLAAINICGDVYRLRLFNQKVEL